MSKAKVLVNQENFFDSDHSDEESRDSDPDDEHEETQASHPQTLQPQDDEKSGMASVIARILSRDTSNSNRVLLAKGKTSKEILKDISDRKRQRAEAENVNLKSKRPRESQKVDFDKEEKRKLWESLSRRMPSILDNPKEVKLRKIATQGMVQLFRLVSTRQMQG